MPSRCLLVVILVLLSSSPAAAGESDPRLSASTRTVLRAAEQGVALPLPGRLNPENPTRISVSIRFASGPAGRLLGELEGLGVEFYRAGGEVLHVGAIYPATVPVGAIRKVAARDDVARVETSLAAKAPELVDNYPPDDRSRRDLACT